MKKKLFLLFFLITGGLFGQLTPEFEFELYFEDAAGNKDTITLGYDENATDSVDIAFGEANLAGQLWGEDLDVRIGDIAYSYDSWFSSNGVPFVTIDSNSFLTKVQILQKPFISSSCDFSTHSYFPGRLSILICAENYPVTVSWDKTVFASGTDFDCRYSSSFFGTDDYTGIDGGDLSMLMGQNSIKLINDSVYETWYPVHRNTPTNYYFYNNKKISVLQFSFLPSLLSNLSEYGNNHFNVYPNPIQSGDLLNIDLNGAFIILDMNGVIVQRGETNDKKIKVGSLNKGLYILSLAIDNNQFNTKIIIK